MIDKKFAGVDLGGTTITAGVVEGSEILELKTVPTLRERPANEIFQTIVTLIKDVSKRYTISGIGIGVPVPSGPETEVLIPSENLPTMGNFPLKQRLEEYFNIPVLLENDARCMALGEHRAGALKGCSHCVCITLGTGLGCGIIIDGWIYRGKQYFAGEIWNIPCDNGTILEDSVAIGGLKTIYKELSGNDLEPQSLYEKYLKGDQKAIDAFDRYGEAVGMVAVMILSFLDPEKIAIGGGISQSFNAFRKGLFRVVEKTWGKEATDKIVPAELSSKAAIIGAAALVKDELIKNLKFKV